MAKETRRPVVESRLDNAIQNQSAVRDVPAFRTGTQQGDLLNSYTSRVYNQLGNFTSSLATNYIANKQDEAALRGQIAATQGTTLEELKEEEGSNKYAIEGWRVLSASTHMANMIAELNSNMEVLGEQSPDEFNTYLASTFSDSIKDITDPTLKKYIQSTYNSKLPEIVSAQVLSNQRYTKRTTSKELEENLISTLNPQLDSEIITGEFYKAMKSSGFLSESEKQQAVYSAVTNSLSNGDPSLYKALQKTGLIKNYPANIRNSILQSYKAQQSNRILEVSDKLVESLSALKNDIASKQDLSFSEVYDMHKTVYEGYGLDKFNINTEGVYKTYAEHKAASELIDKEVTTSWKLDNTDNSIMANVIANNISASNESRILDVLEGNIVPIEGLSKDQVLGLAIASEKFSDAELKDYALGLSTSLKDTGKKTPEGRTIWSKNGEVFSEKTITKEINGSWYNIPTVDSSGKTLSDGDALRAATSQGENVVDTLTGTTLKAYKNVNAAVKAAEARSNAMPKLNLDSPKNNKISSYIEEQYNPKTGWDAPTTAEIGALLKSENEETIKNNILKDEMVVTNTIKSLGVELEERAITLDDYIEGVETVLKNTGVTLTKELNSLIQKDVNTIKSQDYGKERKDALSLLELKVKDINKENGNIYNSLGIYASASDYEKVINNWDNSISKALEDSGLHPYFLNVVKSKSEVLLSAFGAQRNAKLKRARTQSIQKQLKFNGKVDEKDVEFIDSAFKELVKKAGVAAANNQFPGYVPENFDMSDSITNIISNIDITNIDPEYLKRIEDDFNNWSAVKTNDYATSNDLIKDDLARGLFYAIEDVLQENPNRTIEGALQEVVPYFRDFTPEDLKRAENVKAGIMKNILGVEDKKVVEAEGNEYKNEASLEQQEKLSIALSNESLGFVFRNPNFSSKGGRVLKNHLKEWRNNNIAKVKGEYIINVDGKSSSIMRAMFGTNAYLFNNKDIQKAIDTMLVVKSKETDKKTGKLTDEAKALSIFVDDSETIRKKQETPALSLSVGLGLEPYLGDTLDKVTNYKLDFEPKNNVITIHSERGLTSIKLDEVGNFYHTYLNDKIKKRGGQ